MTDRSLAFKLLQWYGLALHHPGQWRVHAALRRLLQVNIDQEFEVQRQGLKWILNPSDFMQQDLFWLGIADRWELYHALRFIRADSVILDVGANIGYYSMMIASALGGRCEIHAFEPAEETHARLTRNIALNGLTCIRAHRVGLADVPGWARILRPAGNSGAAYLEGGGRETPVSTLDHFVREQALRRVDFIKIDVEGLEERVLRGASEVLSRHRPMLLVELQPLTLQRAGSSVSRLLELLDAQGYEVWEPNWHRLVPLRKRTASAWLVNIFGHPKQVLGSGTVAIGPQPRELTLEGSDVQARPP